MEGEYAQLSLQPGRREEEEGEDVDDWDDIYFVDYVDEDDDDDEDDDEDYVAEEGTEDTRYYSAPDESDVSSVMEEIQETQGNEDDDDVEITQVITRDARGMESHGSARDTLRAMNSQAIGGPIGASLAFSRVQQRLITRICPIQNSNENFKRC